MTTTPTASIPPSTPVPTSTDLETPLRTLGIPAWFWLGGIVILLFVSWMLGLFKTTGDERISTTTTTAPAHGAPTLPKSSPIPSTTYRLKPDGQEWVELKLDERLTITLKQDEWFPVKSDGKRYTIQWVTPDRKLKVRFEFWNGVTTEQEFVAGQSKVELEMAPCNWQFVHPKGGTVWIIPE